MFEAFADRPLPGAEFIGARHICLPLYPSLSRERRRLRRRVPRDRAQRDGSVLSNELIAITGGSGFVGSHVVDALLAAGYEVRVIDPKPPAQPERRVGRRRHARPGLGHRRVEERARRVPPRGDGRRERHRRRPGRERRAQHPRRGRACSKPAAAPTRAASSSPAPSGCTPRPTATSSTRPRRSTSRPTATSTCRRRSRPRCSAATTRRSSAVPYTVLRYGIPFGPRMRSDLVVAAFLLRAMRGEPLRIDGDGSQERRFVYVEDLAAAHVLALEAGREEPHVQPRIRRGDLDPAARGDGARSRRRRRGDVRADPPRRLPRPDRAERPRPRRAGLGAPAHLRRRPDARRSPGTETSSPTRERPRPAPDRGGSRLQRRADGRRSVLEELYPLVDELVVVDDGSTDNTRVEIEGLLARGRPNCRLLVHEVNRGMSEAYLTALDRAAGPARPGRAPRRRPRVHRRRRRSARPPGARGARRDDPRRRPRREHRPPRPLVPRPVQAHRELGAVEMGERVGRRAAARRRVRLPHLPPRCARAHARVLLGLPVQRDGRGRGRPLPARLQRPQRPRGAGAGRAIAHPASRCRDRPGGHPRRGRSGLAARPRPRGVPHRRDRPPVDRGSARRPHRDRLATVHGIVPHRRHRRRRGVRVRRARCAAPCRGRRSRCSDRSSRSSPRGSSRSDPTR